MKVYLTDQSKHFPKHLSFLKGKEVIKYNITQLREKTDVIKISTAKSLHDLDTRFFFDYKIFPPNIMTFLTEWHYEKRRMEVGDTIAQQVFIPPFKFFSQKIVFGVRINKIITDSTKVGFSYETLQGHVEMGESTFTIEQLQTGQMVFKIHTFSKPGNIITQLMAPFFSLPYQTFCTKHALKNVKQQLEELN